MDEVSLAKEKTIPHVSEVSCHLLHPLPVGVRRYPTDAHAASGDIDDKQDMVADEPERVHNLDGEQVCRSDGAPMSLDEGAPRHALASLRGRRDTVLGEDPLDGVASEFMSEVLECAL